MSALWLLAATLLALFGLGLGWLLLALALRLSWRTFGAGCLVWALAAAGLALAAMNRG